MGIPGEESQKKCKKVNLGQISEGQEGNLRICGKEFWARSNSKKYCSPHCRKLAGFLKEYLVLVRVLVRSINQKEAGFTRADQLAEERPIPWEGNFEQP